MLFCKVWIVCGIHTLDCSRYVGSEECSRAAGYESRVRINIPVSEAKAVISRITPLRLLGAS
jgi:hypothetical protein